MKAEIERRASYTAAVLAEAWRVFLTRRAA